jgi:predicted acyl esterase
MQIDWDVQIPMDDGLVVRADVFRPDGAGRHPVLMSYGPYGRIATLHEPLVVVKLQPR